MALLRRVITIRVAKRLVTFLQALALVKIQIGIYMILPLAWALLVSGVVLLIAFVAIELVLDASSEGEAADGASTTS